MDWSSLQSVEETLIFVKFLASTVWGTVEQPGKTLHWEVFKMDDILKLDSVAVQLGSCSSAFSAMRSANTMVEGKEQNIEVCCVNIRCRSRSFWNHNSVGGFSRNLSELELLQRITLPLFHLSIFGPELLHRGDVVGEAQGNKRKSGERVDVHVRQRQH